MDRTAHWETVYQTKSSTEVSWYEPDPKQSLDLILVAAGEERGRVIDVGGGQSFLVDRLLDSGFAQVAVLDISSAAIAATKARLGELASQVKWIVADRRPFHRWHVRQRRSRKMQRPDDLPIRCSHDASSVGASIRTGRMQRIPSHHANWQAPAILLWRLQTHFLNNKQLKPLGWTTK